jgi:dTDP-glucose 4,6-dehydratase
MGCSINIESEDQRLRPEKSEVERLLANNALALELLHWQPKVSLEEGLSRTIDWIKANLDKYRPDAYVL